MAFLSVRHGMADYINKLKTKSLSNKEHTPQSETGLMLFTSLETEDAELVISSPVGAGRRGGGEGRGGER